MVFSGFEDVGVGRSDGSILWVRVTAMICKQTKENSRFIAGFRPILNYLQKTKKTLLTYLFQKKTKTDAHL